MSFLEDGKNIGLASVAKPLAQIFPYQLTFISELDSDFNDFIFIAANQPINIEGGTLQPEQSAWLRKRLLHLDQQAGVILTDNFNPLEHLQARKAEYYRHLLVDTIGTQFFIR